MHILHTSPPMGPSYGGPFQSVRKLALAQVRRGMDAEVRMPWGQEAEAHQNEWNPVKVSIGGRVSIPALGWSGPYGREIVDCGADILHSHGIWLHPSWVAIAWKKRYARPHVCSVRGMLEPWAWNHHRMKKRPVWWLWEQRNLQSAALLHATAGQEAEALRTRGLRAPIAVIPNGVEIPDSGVLSQRPSPRPLTALFLSRIHPKKGLPLLLEAWAKVRPEGWSLHVVGPDEGRHRAELERQATLLGISGLVRFSGPLTGEDKTAAFLESSLFILPTHSENFGIAVAEALAHGLPVITTHGAPWELLTTENCGWWVPVSVDGIAEALDDACSRSPDELAAMGATGRAIMAERFSWDGIAAQFSDCYRWLLGDGPEPACVV